MTSFALEAARPPVADTARAPQSMPIKSDRFMVVPSLRHSGLCHRPPPLRPIRPEGSLSSHTKPALERTSPDDQGGRNEEARSESLLQNGQRGQSTPGGGSCVDRTGVT